MEEKEIIKGNLKTILVILTISLYPILNLFYEIFHNLELYDFLDFFEYVLAPIWGLFVLASIILVPYYFFISKMQIVVTNTRVYGKSAFGKRVDLPLDTISAVGTSFLKGIDIGTSAGRIHFKGIENHNQIHEEISKLLNDRQKERNIGNQKQENNSSNAEEFENNYTSCCSYCHIINIRNSSIIKCK